MDLFSRIEHAAADGILLRLEAAILRRLIATAALLALCLVVLLQGYESFSGGNGSLVPIFLALAGLYGAWRFWQSSDNGLELTLTELREIGGRRIVQVADIDKIGREAFGILKPTNGFVIETREKLPGAISPGIWWRFGRHIGVGGLTGAGEGKAMAELLQEILKRRNPE